MRDVWIVCRKELYEWLRTRSSVVAFLFNMLVFVGVFGILMPLVQPGLFRVATPFLIFYFFFLPSQIAVMTVADSFAGERERKTLETLLATRLPDRSIFIGKLLAVLLYTAVLLLAVDVSVLVVVNLADPAPEVFLFSPPILFALGPLALAVTLFVANVGLLVSLRVRTVRAVQQLCSFGILALSLPMILGVVHVKFDWPWLIGAFASTFGVACIFTVYSISRFQRDKLI